MIPEDSVEPLVDLLFETLQRFVISLFISLFWISRVSIVSLFRILRVSCLLSTIFDRFYGPLHRFEFCRALFAVSGEIATFDGKDVALVRGEVVGFSPNRLYL